MGIKFYGENVYSRDWFHDQIPTVEYFLFVSKSSAFFFSFKANFAHIVKMIFQDIFFSVSMTPQFKYK